MISQDRLNKANVEGMKAAYQTKGCPHLTMNPYNPYTKQGKSFNRGWNQIRRSIHHKFKFLRAI